MVGFRSALAARFLRGSPPPTATPNPHPPGGAGGTRARLRAVGTLTAVVGRESVATLRCAAFPLARLHPMPPRPTGGRPVVLVHGFLGHPDMFRPLVRRLYGAGRGRVEAPGYPSTVADLDHILRLIEATVRRLAGRGTVDLIGHSLGAVACRAWLKTCGGHRRVHRFVSLGGPHAGTGLYRFAPRRLWPVPDPDGPWVRRLARGPEPVPTVVVRARYDHQILPPRRAALPGVPEVVLGGHGHNGLLWDSRAHDAVLAALAGDAASAPPEPTRPPDRGAPPKRR